MRRPASPRPLAATPAAAGVRLSDEQVRALAGDHRRRLSQCVPWSPAMAWARQLNLVGASFTIRELFPQVAATDDPVDLLTPGQRVDSPSGEFRYCVRVQRRGQPMLTWWGSQVGTVIFDADVGVPALFQARDAAAPGEGVYGAHPWMSLTPAELLTLRPGTRLARGHTVIAGLGLGHQLIEVSRRLQVKRVTLVERSQELVDWLLPVVERFCKRPIQVIVGDAYEVLPTLRADVALVDIFPGYGDAARAMGPLTRACKGIKKFWGWGSSEMSGARLAER